MNTSVQHRARLLGALVTVLGSIGGTTPVAGAQEADASPDADEVVMPPTTVRTPPQDLFALEGLSGLTLPSDEFTIRRPVRFLPDALEETPSIGLQRTGIGQTSPFIRGFTGFRTLYLIDGFRLNHAAWRDGPNQYLATVDSELIDRLVVRYGSGNVPFGTDAVGGSVAMITHAPGPFIEGREHTAEVALRLSSADRGVVSRVAAGGTFGDVAYRIGATRRTFDDLKGGRDVGLQENTGYDAHSADVKLAWHLDEQSTLTVAHQREDQRDVPRAHRTQFGIDWRGLDIGSDRRRDLDQFRRLTSLTWKFVDGELFDEFEAGLARHEQDERRTRIRSDGRRDRQGFDVDTAALFARGWAETSIGQLQVGLDASRDAVDSFRRNFDADGTFAGDAIQGPVADDARYDLVGVFAQNEIELATDWWLTVGGRLARADLDADHVADPETGDPISLEDDWTTWAAEVRLLHRIDEQHDVYASVSRTSRMPNLSDVTRLDSARSDEIETPSPGLDPEEFLTAELGARHRGDRITIEASAYHTWIRELIVRFPTGDIVDGDAEVQKDNASEGRLWGADARASYRIDDAWSAHADAFIVAGRSDTFGGTGNPDRAPISRLPPLTANLRLRWADPDSSCWAEGVCTVADEQDRLSPRDESDSSRIPSGGTPGFTVFGLRGGFSPREHWDVTLALENLTDVDYRYHGSGVNEPGTQIVLGLRARF